ncbi:hypothetical protein ACLB2K_047669 [Fragaria x ananassa]
MQYAQANADGSGMFYCPCKMCKCRSDMHRFPFDTVWDHLKSNGFWERYTCWIYHGETSSCPHDHGQFYHSGSTSNDPTTAFINDMFPHDSGVCPERQHIPQAPMQAVPRGVNTAGIAKYNRLIAFQQTPLCPGHEKTVLQCVMEVMHIKVDTKSTVTAVDRYLQYAASLLPDGHRHPTTHHKVRRILRDLGLSYIKIHACRYDCVLFWGKDADGNDLEGLHRCPANADGSGMFYCPCKMCKCRSDMHRFPFDTVWDHLKSNGFWERYTCWIYHGETSSCPHDHGQFYHSGSTSNDPTTAFINDMFPHDSGVCPERQHIPQAPMQAVPRGVNTAGIAKYNRLIAFQQTPLCPGHEKTVLQCVMEVMHIKVDTKSTVTAVDRYLQYAASLLPDGHRHPTTHHKVRHILRDLGLSYIKIHACRYDCVLFWGKDADGNDLEGLHRCPANADGSGMFYCPCKMCKCRSDMHRFPFDTVWDHLKSNGFWERYTCWIYHGETSSCPHDHGQFYHSGSTSNDPTTAFINDMFPHDSGVCPERQHIPQAPMQAVPRGVNTAGIAKYNRLIAFQHTPLCPGHEKIVLQCVMEVMYIKVDTKSTVTAVDRYLQYAASLLPDGHRHPTTHHKVRRILRDLGLSYIKIHACRYDCVLFWGKDADGNDLEGLHRCPGFASVITNESCLVPVGGSPSVTLTLAF